MWFSIFFFSYFQNNENGGAVSLNLSLSKGETGVLHKMDNILATDSTDDVFSNRSNWDLNTPMDTWDGSSSDEHAAQVTAVLRVEQSWCQM
jgi:hypothetical protein